MRARPTRIGASTAAAALIAAAALTASPAGAAPTGAATPPVTSAPIDYFDDVYPSLDAGSVFETVTYERFEYLLASEGTFAFLVGGPADAGTQGAVAHLEAEASRYGLEQIYVFDPRLDGADVDVRTSQIPEIAGLWTNLVTNYLSKDVESSFADTAQAPYFFVYDKDRTVEGAEDRVVAALSGPVPIEQLATPSGAEDYRADVAAVLDVAATGEPGARTLEVDTVSLFDFYRTQYNGRHQATYGAEPAKYGGDILTDEDADFRLQQITYPELVNLLESDEEHVIFFGGTWCHNTRAVVKEINAQAVAADVEVVYNFDLRLDGLSGDGRHIRDSRSPLSHLYGDLVSTYLPNLQTQYQVDSANANHYVTYRPGGDPDAELAKAKKLQVPFLLQYDKGNTVEGAAAPVARQWLTTNDAGATREFMTEWWYVNGLPGYETDPARLATEYAFAAQAVAGVETFFAGQKAGATAPAAPTTPQIAVNGADVTVTWAAPVDNGSALTGYGISLNGAEPITVGADVLVRTFTGLPVGDYSATVSASNAVGTSANSPVSATVTVVAADGGGGSDNGGGAGGGDGTIDVVATGGTLAVSGDVRPGGTIQVRGSAFAANTSDLVVTLNSDPVTLGTVTTDADGAFALTAAVPTSITPGQHTVQVTWNGALVAEAAVTVAAAPTSEATPGATSTATGGVVAGGPARLSNTGVSAGELASLLVIGALAVASGTALVLRRRRQTGESA